MEKKTICLIDDNSGIRTSTVGLFTFEYPDAEIHTFQDAESALSFIQSNKVDVLVTDLHISGARRSHQIGRVIYETKKRNPRSLVIVNSVYGMDQMTSLIARQDTEFRDFRPSVADMGTGDDAATPSMVERAASRNATVPVSVSLLGLIDHTMVKDTPALIDYIKGQWAEQARNAGAGLLGR